MSWYQVDLLENTHLTAIETYGRGDEDTETGAQYVSSFKLQYGPSPGALKVLMDPVMARAPAAVRQRDPLEGHKLLEGNTDCCTRKFNWLPRDVTARFVRLLPWSGTATPVLRLELWTLSTAGSCHNASS